MAGEHVVALVAQAELELAAGELGAATSKLDAVILALSGTEGEHDLLGRALWLSALIALANGQLGVFTEQAHVSIDSLERGGENARAQHAGRLLDEILRRVDSDLSVEAGGALGLLEVLESHLERLILRAEDGSDWAAIDRDRAQLTQLVSAPVLGGGDQPLSRLLRTFGLDAIDAVALTVIIPLATSPSLRARALLLVGDDGVSPGVPVGLIARLSFALGSAQDQLLRSLAPGASLRRQGIVELLGAGPPERERVDLASSIAWALHGAAVEEMPPLPGVSVVRPSAASIPLDQSLSELAETLTRWAGARASVVVLAGRRGAGKATLAAAVAAATGRPLITVDAAGVSLASWNHTLASVARDGLLGSAIVYLRCDLDLPPLHAIATTPGLHLIVGVDPGDAVGLCEAMRNLRADVVPLAMPALEPADQVAAWQRAFAAHAVDGIENSELGPVLRPGLVLGDLMDSVTESVVRSDAAGEPLTCPLLAQVLTERMRSELESYAELASVAGGPALVAGAPALDRAALQLRQSFCVLDEWGMAPLCNLALVRGAIAVVSADAEQRLAAALHLAHRLAMPLCHLDLVDLAGHPPSAVRARLGELARAAGRAGALVFLSGIDQGPAQAPGLVPYSVGDILAAPSTGFVIGVELGSSLRSSVRRHLTAVVELTKVGKDAA